MTHPGLADGPIYLDYNATTPVDPRVVDAALNRPGFDAHHRAEQGSTSAGVRCAVHWRKHRS